MSLSALLIMTERGDTLLGKFYREDVGYVVAFCAFPDLFWVV